MKLILNKNVLGAHPEQFLRRAGYAYIRDRKTGKESFVRRLGNGFYPRLHMYFDQNGENVIFNLHLDQKQASYEGSHMHSGEYDGEVVAGEIERLRSLVGPQEKSVNLGGGDNDILDSIEGDRNYQDSSSASKKKSWLRRLFGF